MEKIQLHAATPPRRDRLAISLDEEDARTIMDALAVYRFELQMMKEQDALTDYQLHNIQRSLESVYRIMYYIKCSNITL
ncbi:MAG: hypothetical protein IJ551_09680 [Prevotella sp.]|nr:hypothetical protein [Prevotella sp.]